MSGKIAMVIAVIERYWARVSRLGVDPRVVIIGAALFPDRMLALVMGEVARLANDPLPMAQRAPRIAALDRELDELHRLEEALIVDAIAAGQSVHRSPAAVLGIRVTEKISRAA